MGRTGYLNNSYDIKPQVGFISSVNSSTTVLAGGATFTGEWEDVSQFTSMSVFAFSDQDSATDGLSMQLSTDGVNADRAKTETLTANNSQVHILASVSKFFRVVYTNGSTIQTSFRLQTIHHVTKARELTSGTRQVLEKWDDVTLSRLVNEPEFDRNIGRISYESTKHIFGTNDDVGTTFEDIWAAGGVYPWPTAAETVRVKAGGNVADVDTTGAGARKIIVEGLDENWAVATEEISLAGADASSPTTTTFIRVYDVKVTDCGTYTGANTGDIQVENTTATNVLANVKAGVGHTQLSMYTIPANKTGYLVRIEVQAETTNTAEVRLFKREGADNVSAPFTSKVLIHRVLDFSGSESIILKAYESLPEKTDIWADGKKITGGGNTEIEAEYDIILVDN